MNKVFNINLGGYPFTIDQNAYEFLSNYLDTIHHHFETSEGYEEITADIEARMAELFHEELEGRQIVTLKDVKTAISIMGTPEDFGAEPMQETKGNAESKWTFSTGIKTGKRLFRNGDDEVVGGVCSGIAAYFGITDPLWVRILFVLITISGGVGILPYIILWAIVPKAETAADRLAMRGEPINVSNIAKTIEDELDHLSETLSDFGTGKSKSRTSKKKELVERIVQERPLRKGFHC
ncbi:MAG: PspC domain-containing protein [Bacteroidota bacterium]